MQPHSLDLQWAATLLSKYMQQMTSDKFIVWKQECYSILRATSNAAPVGALLCLITRKCYESLVIVDNLQLLKELRSYSIN